MMIHDNIWLTNEITNLRRDLADLKKTVEFQQRVLETQSFHIAGLRAAVKEQGMPRVQEFTAADAYREAIEIAERMKGDFWTRNIPDSKSKEWVNATIEDIVRALQHRLDRCEGRV